MSNFKLTLLPLALLGKLPVNVGSEGLEVLVFKRLGVTDCEEQRQEVLYNRKREECIWHQGH